MSLLGKLKGNQLKQTDKEVNDKSYRIRIKPENWSPFIHSTYIYWLFHCLLAQGHKRYTTKTAHIWQKKELFLERLSC